MELYPDYRSNEEEEYEAWKRQQENRPDAPWYSEMKKAKNVKSARIDLREPNLTGNPEHAR